MTVHVRSAAYAEIQMEGSAQFLPYPPLPPSILPSFPPQSNQLRGLGSSPIGVRAEAPAENEFGAPSHWWQSFWVFWSACFTVDRSLNWPMGGWTSLTPAPSVRHWLHTVLILTAGCVWLNDGESIPWSNQRRPNRIYSSSRRLQSAAWWTTGQRSDYKGTVWEDLGERFNSLHEISSINITITFQLIHCK